MKSAARQILVVLIVLAAGTVLGNYQSPVASGHSWPGAGHAPAAPKDSPSALLVYDSEGVLSSIAVPDPALPFIHVLEPIGCEAPPANPLNTPWLSIPPSPPKPSPQANGLTLRLPADIIRFQGREYDAETGLYYFRHRYYDPELGRFTQTDPMGYDDSMNLYQAFNQSPQNFGDPMGEFTIADLMRYAERYGEAIGRAAKKDTIYQAFKENKEAWPSLKPIPSNYWQIAKEEFIPDEFQSLNPFATYEAYKEREAELKKADVDLLAAQGEALSRRNKSGVMAAELQQEAAQKQYNIAAATHGINMLGWVSLGTAGLNKLYSPGAIGKIYKTGTIGETAAWEKSGQCVQCTNAAEALHPGSTHLRIELPRIGKHSILKVDEGLFYDETLRGNIGVYFGKPPIPEGKVYFTQEELDAITKMLLKWTK
jgi:RHS repeat-associated protein